MTARVNTGVLAAAEKRLLIWMAERLPQWVHSDMLTLLAFVAMGVTGAGFAAARWETRALWLVVGGLAINWFGDSLDGTLARVRRVERPRYGYYIDHALDIAGTALLMGGLALSGFMAPVIALVTLSAYLMAAGEVYLATASGRDFRMSFAGLGPTELRIVLAAGALTLFNDPHVNLGALGAVRAFDIGGIVAATGLLIAFGAAVTKNGRALASAERVRTTRPREC